MSQKSAGDGPWEEGQAARCLRSLLSKPRLPPLLQDAATAWLSDAGAGQVPTGSAVGQLNSAADSSKGCHVPGRASPLSGHRGPRPGAAREPIPPASALAVKAEADRHQHTPARHVLIMHTAAARPLRQSRDQETVQAARGQCRTGPGSVPLRPARGGDLRWKMSATTPSTHLPKQSSQSSFRPVICEWVHTHRDATNRGRIVSTLAGSVGEGPPPAWVPTFRAPPPIEGVIWIPHWTGRPWAANSCRGLSAGSGGQ